MNSSTIYMSITDHLVMDMCCYEDPDAYTCMSVDSILNGSYVKLLEALKPSVRRYVLPLNLSKRVSNMLIISTLKVLKL